MSSNAKSGDAAPESNSDNPQPDNPQPDNPNSKKADAETPAAQAELELRCPQCGGKHFHTTKGLIAWCLSCGKTLTNWAYQNAEYAEASREYVKRTGNAVPGQTVHSDTPACTAKSPRANGDLVVCGSKDWQHDGQKLLYCRVCGANYTGEQPENIQDVIETLGPALPDLRPPKFLKKVDSVKEANGANIQRPGVDLEKFRAVKNS
jgi:ribosomal protein L37AE/L43A